MPKEKSYNPVQAQRKADKAKAIKKGKSELQERRNERLARRNPNQIQRQIDDLKAVTANGGKLSQHEEQTLGGLEKELKAVTRAREALGDRAPAFGRGTHYRDGQTERGAGVLGKRRRGSQNGSSSDEDIPEDVQRIPMPRDTPPPIPKDVLDAWYAKRRARRNAEQVARGFDKGGDGEAKVENDTPVVEHKTIYEAKPVVRNLQKEAVTAFVPTVVQTKLKKSAGQGGLIEPEEADRLEQQGYLRTNTDVTAALESSEEQTSTKRPLRTVTLEEVEDEEE